MCQERCGCVVLLLLCASALVHCYGLVEILISVLLTGDKNKHRYVIATQSQPLRNHLRTIPAVPIIHIKKSVVILEPPSDTTLSIKAEVCLSLLKRLSCLLTTLSDGPLPTVHSSPRRPKNPPCTLLHPSWALCLSLLPNLTCHYGGRRRPKGPTL